MEDKRNYEQYKKKIDGYAGENSDESISHFGKHESAIILGSIFKYASEYVKMYVGDFNGDISNNKYYSSQVKNYLQNGGELEVIITGDVTQPSEVFRSISLYEGFRDNVKLLYSDNLIELEMESNDSGRKKVPVHFAVADDRMYRLEIDTMNYFGIASFNDNDFAVWLREKFDKELQKALLTKDSVS